MNQQNVFQQINESPVAKTTMKAFLYLGGGVIAALLNAKVGVDLLTSGSMETSSVFLMAVLGTVSMLSSAKSVESFNNLSEILAKEKFEKHAIRIEAEDNYKPRNKM